MKNERKFGLRSKQKRDRVELKYQVSQQFSKVNFTYLFLLHTKFPLFVKFYIVMANDIHTHTHIFLYRNLVLLPTYNIIIIAYMENIIRIN